MDAASRKLRSGSAMRVATLFTGVAACTVGMTQVANAQDTHPAGRASAKHIDTPIHSPSTNYGSIRSTTNCAEHGVDKTWLHVSTTHIYPPVSYSYNSDCFGFAGNLHSTANTGIRAECGGNNRGYLFGRYSKGGSWSLGFGPGATYRTYVQSHLNDVMISGWTGNDTCGLAPDFGGGKFGAPGSG